MRKPAFNKREWRISVLTKIIQCVFLIILVIFCGYALAEGPLILSLPDTQILEKPLRAELVFKLGSNKPNEDFYRLRSFTVDKKNGQIYILDTGNSRIQCFSKEGKFLFSFGRRGQGPGELSNNASKIKILSDGNIYVIDNRQRRINVYNLEGKFLFSGKTKFEFSTDTTSFSAFFNDIVLLNNVYYLSSFYLEENHKPIHISHKLGKVDSSFGTFVEPAVNQLKRISKLPHPDWWRMWYANSGITKLVAANKNEIIFSQAFPYLLIKYDAKGQVLKDIMGDVEFDTHHHVEYVSGKIGTIMRTYPSHTTGIVLDVSINRDNQVVVPYLNPEQDFFYIDIYDLDLNLISRYKMKNIIAVKKGEYIGMGDVMIDNDNNLYALVISEENYPQLVKYKLIFE
ncbi:MAG: 6-bladed beta-propeller [Candidatus Aminicenantes bacterium]|nr:6-bladed beta-propeller [Candidatus Aminicenantes bacterium]OQY09301.1 MAG: hypothetical protein B6I30_10015 [Desulfobacteraceae bacterium 4572_187]